MVSLQRLVLVRPQRLVQMKQLQMNQRFGRWPVRLNAKEQSKRLGIAMTCHGVTLAPQWTASSLIGRDGQVVIALACRAATGTWEEPTMSVENRAMEILQTPKGVIQIADQTQSIAYSVNGMSGLVAPMKEARRPGQSG